MILKNKRIVVQLLLKLLFIIILGIGVFYYYILRSNNTNIIHEKWVKYYKNPVLGNDKTDTIFDPYVMIDNNGLYRNYVSWRIYGAIAISTSVNGFTWSDLKIVLDKGKENNWDAIVNRASVIYKDGIYLMWFTGQNNGISKIGFARSADGYNFEKFEKPILIPEYDYEKYSVMNPHVIYDGKEKIYKMWYSAGETLEPDVIGYATSEDGISWVKYNYNPIFTPSKNKLLLDSFKIGGCDVHKISDNKYIMFYIGYSNINTARIFVSESKDGISNWKRSINPIIYSTDKDDFDGEACYKPSAIYDKKSNKWMLWYNGRKKNKEYIGLAICNSFKII
jgi:predicted GH43/DUF377 family glycosyl hydrolase